MLLLINDLTEETVIDISRYSIGLATLAGREFDKNLFTGSESDKTSYHSGRTQVILFLMGTYVYRAGRVSSFLTHTNTGISCIECE